MTKAKLYILSVLAIVLVALVAYALVNPFKVPNKASAVTHPTKEEVLSLVNAERSKAHISPLVADADIDKAAQLKSDDMTSRGYEEHLIKGTNYTLSPQMADLEFKHCSYTSENFYWGTGDQRSAESAITWWMHSKPHHDAILDPRYTLTGIGVSGTDKVTIVEHFCIAK